MLAKLFHRYHVTSRLLTMRRRWGSSRTKRLAEAHLLQASSLFDANWYLQAYSDVAEANIDPLTHYLRDGWREGRDPGPEFATLAYLRANPDVARSGMNPLLHFIEFGQSEGREPFGHRPIASKWVAVDFGFDEPPPWRTYDQSSPREMSWCPAHRLDPSAPGFLAVSGLPLGYAEDPGRRSLVQRCFASLASLSGFGALTPYEETASRNHLADTWLGNAWHLRTRWTVASPTVVRGYQYDPSDGGALRIVGEQAVGSPADVADFTLPNPYFPLLTTLSEPQGSLTAAQILPFPSLCRGGAHYTELLASVGDDPVGPFEVGQRLAEQLVRMLIDNTGTVSTIAVDCSASDGTGWFSQPEFQAWLERVARVRVEPIAGHTQMGGTPWIDPIPGSRSAGGVLVVSGSMLPTIAILSENGATRESGEKLALPVLLARNRAPEALLIRQPPAMPALPALASDIGPANLPVLRNARLPVDLPAAAICPARPRPLSDAEMLLPMAGGAATLQRPPITWLIEANGKTDPRCTLQTIGVQEGGQRDCVALVGRALPHWVPADDSVLGGRLHDFRELGSAIDAIDTPLAVFIGAGVTLSDKRTASLFASLLDEPSIATVCCVMTAVNNHGKTGHPTIADLGAINCDGKLGSLEEEMWRRTYAVASPTPRLWGARTADIRHWFHGPPSADLGEAFHLCSYLTAASCDERGERQAPAWVPPARSDQITKLRVLVG